MNDFKIMIELQGRVCDSVEFESYQDAFNTGRAMLQKKCYEEGEVVIVKVYGDGTTKALGAPRL